MLNLLRKIRRKLINEGRLKKYVIYAIGEILLVMIGILLALQVNNWNEQRKTFAQEETLLQDLYADFKTNKDLIGQGLERHLYFKSTGETWIKMMAQDVDNVERTPFLDSLLFWGPDYTIIDFVQASLNNIISGQKLEILRNEKLKQMLIAYPLLINKYKNSELEIKRIVIEKIRPHGEKHMGIRQMFDGSKAFDSDYTALLRDRQLNNDYVNKHWQLDQALAELEDVSNATDIIIDILEKELAIKP